MLAQFVFGWVCIVLTFAVEACFGTTQQPVPVIDVTDLYHPHQDKGDNFDILTAYALPEIDLQAVVLDCTEPFRQPVAENPGPGLFPDSRGPREPGFIPIRQLNYIFNRNVPCGAGPFTRMKSPTDRMLDVPPFQQQGIELLLETLRRSARPVHILSFGSARAVAAAFNRKPELFREKVARIHLSAGGSSPPVPGYLEWNVALDPRAIVRLLRSDLPIALYPCAANNPRSKGHNVLSPAFSYDSHNTFYKLPDLRFISRMDSPLRRYLEFAIARSARADFLRAMETDDGATFDVKLLDGGHNVWETALWICVSGRRLIRRADGSHHLVLPEQVERGDTVLPNELRPCELEVFDNGVYQFRETNEPTNCLVYYRGDPREHEAALREVLPRLYLSFKARPEGGDRHKKSSADGVSQGLTHEHP